jgi:hypothetical protein
VGHRRPAQHRLRVGAPDLLEADHRVRGAPDGRRRRRLPLPPRAPGLLPRLRHAVRPGIGLPVRDGGRGGGAAPRRRLDGDGGARRRAQRAPARRGAGGQRHAERAVGADVCRGVRRRGAAHQRLQEPDGVRRQASADHRRRQLRLRHRRRRRAPRGLGRPVRAPRLLLRAEVPLRQARRHPQPGQAAASADQAGGRHPGAADVHRRPDPVRVPGAGLPDLRVPPDREHAGPAPPGSRRPAGPARRGATGRRRRGLPRRHPLAVRRGRAGHRLPPALPVPGPRAAALERARQRARPLPQHLHAGRPRPLRAGHDRGLRHRLAGPLRAGRARRVLPARPPGPPRRRPRARGARRRARPDLSGGYHYLGLERMSYYVNKDAYRAAVRAETEGLA